MGVTLYAKKDIDIDLSLGYSWFFELRKDIALLYDQDFGNKYQELSTPKMFTATTKEKKKFDNELNFLADKAKIPNDIIDFLYQPDCNGIINYQTVKKLYNKLKDIKLNKSYSSYNHKYTFKDFIELLRKCTELKSPLCWC